MANGSHAIAGLRSWGRGLHDDLAEEGLLVGRLSIGVPIGPGGGTGDPNALADRWYRLSQRYAFEVTVDF